MPMQIQPPPLPNVPIQDANGNMPQVWQRWFLRMFAIIQTGYAPIDAFYLLSRANADLKNAVNLGLLSSGYLQIAVAGAIATLSAHATVPTTDLSGILQAAQEPAHTGDVTNVAGSLALALAAIVAAGSAGSSTAIPVITIDAKGRVTVLTVAAVIAPAGTLTGAALAANVLASSLTSVGTLTGGASGAGFTLDLGASTVTLPQKGAWTPGLTFGGGSTGMTFATQSGYYFQVGKLIFIQGRLTLSAKGSSTGGAVVTGLPVAIANIAGGQPVFPVWLNGMSATTTASTVLGIINTTTASLWALVTGSISQLADTNFGNNSDVIFSGCYQSV